MNRVLHQYIFVVTIFLWITLSNGCLQTAVGEFMNCTAKLNISVSLETNRIALKHQMSVICKMGPNDKQVFQSCFDTLKRCDQFMIIADTLGTNIMNFVEASEKLCGDEDVILDNMPCLIPKIMAVATNTSTNETKEFQQLYKKGNDLFMQVMLRKILREEYNRKYCPLLVEGIEKVADFRCPEKFTKIIQNYAYDIMSDTCRSINNIASSVTMSPQIPSSNGCMGEAIDRYRKCLSDLNPNLSLHKLSPKGQMEFMCKIAKSEDKYQLTLCFTHFKTCEQFSRTVDILGFEISRWMETFEKLCQYENVLLEDMPCFLQNIMNLFNNNSKNELKEFQLLFEKGRRLFMQQEQNEITREEYYRKYCPLLKEGIEKLADLKCPEKFTKILQIHGYDIMSDKCRSINKIVSSGIKSLPNISFISLLFLILLFVTS
uniref:DUF19 domain-containing protein n=1 Tax=Octopus bimaculoides TaxID=37653 RepID=A0A0L8HMR4_OCTBM|eukprot:XP_014771028.1 PREDICTED: uncharacterized protein LOC106869700 isoform X2 [Octopus bimaculoides]